MNSKPFLTTKTPADITCQTISFQHPVDHPLSILPPNISHTVPSRYQIPETGAAGGIRTPMTCHDLRSVFQFRCYTVSFLLQDWGSIAARTSHLTPKRRYPHQPGFSRSLLCASKTSTVKQVFDFFDFGLYCFAVVFDPKGGLELIKFGNLSLFRREAAREDLARIARDFIVIIITEPGCL